MWEADRRLESRDLKVLCLTADGASSNRKFFGMHGEPFYKTINSFSSDGRSLFFIADPPHLMKTIRNCWSHSGLNSTRLMKVCALMLHVFNIMLVILVQINGQHIVWKQLWDLFGKISGTRDSSCGLSLLPKL